MTLIARQLLPLINASYTPPPHTPAKQSGWERPNEMRKEKLCTEVYAALRAIGRPATRGEITAARGKNVDYRGLNGIHGLARTGGKANGRATWFYWFAGEPLLSGRAPEGL